MKVSSQDLSFDVLPVILLHPGLCEGEGLRTLPRAPIHGGPSQYLATIAYRYGLAIHEK